MERSTLSPNIWCLTNKFEQMQYTYFVLLCFWQNNLFLVILFKMMTKINFTVVKMMLYMTKITFKVIKYNICSNCYFATMISHVSKMTFYVVKMTFYIAKMTFISQRWLLAIYIYHFWPKSRILPPNLNNNWMTAVIGWSRHLTGWTTLQLVGGRTQDLDLIFYVAKMTFYFAKMIFYVVKRTFHLTRLNFSVAKIICMWPISLFIWLKWLFFILLRWPFM